MAASPEPPFHQTVPPSSTSSAPVIHRDIACTVCGCVCDDLVVEVAAGQITPVSGACALAAPWFEALNRPGAPPAEIDGTSVPVEQALDKAAALLRRAQAPLIYGLSRSSTDGQRAATRLADRLGAVIDTTASLCHAPSILALQAVGESTCTLGEIRNRADLVIYWGSNPVVSHPRHLERYSYEPRGQFVPGGAADRRLVVIDVERTETAALADLFIQVTPERDFEALWTLRSLLQGHTVAADADCGASLPALRQLVEWMRGCRCGVVFFGLGLAQAALGHLTVEALLRLVEELNGVTRFHARRMRVYGDVAGADTVLAWQTGFPFSVNLNRGYPRYSPGEYSADDVLRRQEADCCLLVGSEGVDKLSAAAQAHLRQIPRIVLDYPHEASRVPATVRFTTAIYGIHRRGTAYRMDEVPIPLRRITDSPLRSDGDVLRAIAARLEG